MTSPLSIFGSVFSCACGKTHDIAPREVLIAAEADDVFSALPSLLERGCSRKQGRAVVFMDRRTQEAAGEKACAAVSRNGWRVQSVLLPDRSPAGHANLATCGPICDDLTQASLLPTVKSADILLAVGSGAISDLGKWSAFACERPFIVLATAASMNGYASANVAPTIGGLKTLVRAAPPCAVATSLDLLRAAPPEMTAAGLGDILAKSVSSADWLLNHLLFGDYYCQRAVDLIAEIEPLYRRDPEGLRRGDDQPLRALFEGLLLTGAAMTMAETSAPSSGGEHMISHTLDMMSALDNDPHDFHGRQVGVGTILAAEIYRRVLGQKTANFRGRTPEVDMDFWGPLVPAIVREYTAKAERLRQAAVLLAEEGRWPKIRDRLRALVPAPEDIRDCLKRAGAAWQSAHLGCSRSRLLTALRHAHEIRARFTILDLAHLAGVLPEAAEEIVEQWG